MADEKSVFLLELVGLDFGVFSLLFSALLGSMYGVLPLKFSSVCLFPYFSIMMTRFLFIKFSISLFGSKMQFMKHCLNLVVSSSSSIILKASCKLVAAQ